MQDAIDTTINLDETADNWVCNILLEKNFAEFI